jgi:hypothetical protein
VEIVQAFSTPFALLEANPTLAIHELFNFSEFVDTVGNILKKGRSSVDL